MKTTLIDVVKMNGNSANSARIKPAAPKNVESKGFRSSTDSSENSFNKTLKEEQKSTETKFEVSSKKPEKSAERDVKREETTETEEVAIHEVPEKQSDEVDMTEKVEEQAPFAQMSESEETETKEILKADESDVEQVKIKTLMTLLSGEKKTQLPKIERYVANMRNEGKSPEEILSTLKKVFNDLEEKPELTLKDYVLKVRKVESDTENKGQETEKTGDEQKKTVTVEIKSDVKVETQPEVKKDVEIPHENSTEKTPKDAVKSEPLTVQMDNKPVIAPKKESPESSTLNAQLQFKRADVQGKVVSESTKPDVSEVKGSQKLEIVIPEKLVKFLENAKEIDLEKLNSFIESKLIPQEEIEKFINSFNLDSTQDFAEKNESILSQLSDFAKLFDSTKSGDLFTQAKTVTVKSTLVQQFIVKNFTAKNFSEDFWNGRNNMVFKNKTVMQQVQKMTVGFEKMTQTTRATVQNVQKEITNASLGEQRVVQNSDEQAGKTFAKAALMRNGYESPISRRNAFVPTVENNATQNGEGTAKTEVFISQEKEINQFKETILKTETKASESNSSKTRSDSGETKDTLGNNGANQSSEKTSGSLSTTSLNRQTVGSTNLNQIYQKINDMARLMERQSTKVETTTIQLTPPELGKVSLEVVKEGSRISIFMQVESREAQDILQKNSEALAARLSGSGFELQKIQVQMEKYEEQGTEQQNQNADSQNGEQNDENEQNASNESNPDFENDKEYSFTDLLKGGIEDAG